MAEKEKKLEFANLSDGVSDGVVIFYMKDRKLRPVLLNQDQATMLDLLIAAPFVESKMVIASPVEFRAIKEMIIDY